MPRIAASSSPRANRRSTQRERLLGAMLCRAVLDGYAGATVSRVIAAAGVSRPTFYENFTDRAACFKAVHGQLAGQLCSAVKTALAAQPAERAPQAALSALVGFAQAEPLKARFLVSAALQGGPATLGERDRTLAGLQRLIERRRTGLPADAISPDVPVRLLLGAAYWLLAPPLRRGEHDLSGLAAELADWAERYQRPVGEHGWRSLQPGAEHRPSRFSSELALRPPAAIAPGRTSLSSAEVARNHRERILYATAQVAARVGYTASTIADIIAAAGLDRRAFYAHFHNKQQAFLATHELAVQQTLAVTASAFFSATSWPERVWEGLRATARFQTEHPVFAHMGLVEAHAVGAEAVQRVDDSRTAFTIFLQEGTQHTDSPPPRTGQEAIGAAVYELGYHLARRRRSHHATRLGHFAVYITLAPYLGAGEATRLIACKLAEADDTPHAG